jgi:enoyl-CoA hydratase
MEYKNVLYEPKDGIALVTINRPDKMNALNDETINELYNVVEQIKIDDKVWVVIITGSGERAFVAGADIKELAQLDGPSAEAKMLKGQELNNRIENLGKPVIAAINGFALGGGCELAMACHIRLAAETAKLGQPEINLGIIPGYGGTQRLSRLVSRGKALELLLTGDSIPAPEAMRIGLVDAVYPLEALMKAAFDLAAKLLRKSPLAMKAILDAVNEGSKKPFAEALKLEANIFSLLIETDDGEEGLKAFLEKRPPLFLGK